MAAFTRPVLVIAAVLSTAALLGGCTAVEPAPPEPAPLFASDEEALAAAADAYREYLRVSDAIMHDGGENPDRIRAVVDGDMLSTEFEGINHLRNSNIHSSGDSELIAERLIKVQTVGTYVDVVAQVCVDLSDVRIIDSDGVSTPVHEAGLVTSREVVFRFSTVAQGVLVTQIPLSAGGVCEDL